MRFDTLLEITGRQYGCVTRVQALTVMSQDQLAHLAKTGVLVRQMPQVYVLRGSPDSWRQRVMCAVLSVPRAVASHRSAARIWGLTFAADDEVTITGPRMGHKVRPGVHVHQSSQLEPFVDLHEGIPVTHVARTLVDLSSCVSPRQLQALVDQACNLKLVTIEEVDLCLDRMVTKGRSRVSTLREIIAARSPADDKVESFFERRVLKSMRQAGLPEPEAQYVLFANGNRYRLDFAFPEFRLAVEVDGPHHLLASVAAYDRRRDADLTLAGWVVVHVDLEADLHEFTSRLRRVLHFRGTSSTQE